MTGCFQSTEQNTRATGFSCIVINKAGVDTFCTHQPSPIHPLPPAEHHTFLLHRSWGPSVPPPNRTHEHRWRKKAKHFPFLGITWALHWGQLHWQSTTKEGARCGQHMWHHCALPTMPCSTWQQSQASQSKAAECQEILWDEWEPRR